MIAFHFSILINSKLLMAFVGAGAGFNALGFHQGLRSRYFTPQILGGGFAGQAIVAEPSRYISKIDKVLKMDPQGNISSDVPLKAPAFECGAPGAHGILINGIRLGMLATGSALVTKERDIAETLTSWEHEEVNVFADSITVPINKQTYCDSLWVDARGTHYARVKTSFSTGVWVGSNINFWNTMNGNPSFEVQSLTEFVVIGFTYNDTNENIWIPHSVQAVETDQTTGLSVTRNYPVREIWGGIIYGASNSNTALHALSIQEMSKADNVMNVPKAIIAPYITKISLKRRLTQNHMSLFSGACPKVVYMPHLETIVGGGRHTKTPIFCSNNSVEYYTNKLSFPSLKTIKNCMFACQLAGLTAIELPALETIKESIFLMNCPMLKELELPHIDLIEGCDYFCANDYNLEKLTLTSSFSLVPHRPERSSETQVEALELLRATLAVLSLRITRYLINGTNSMSYFLNGCSKLMNTTGKLDAAITEKYPPFNGLYLIDRTRGIFTTFNYKVDYALNLIGKTDTDGYYGANTLCTITQFAHRLGADSYSIGTPEEIAFSSYSGDYKKFGLESTYHLVVADKSAISETSIVCAVDPRTALMNTMTNPVVADSLYSSSTSTHAYTASEFDLHIAVNPNEAYYANEIGITSVNFLSLIAVNQAYNAAAASGTNETTDDNTSTGTGNGN